MQGYKWQEVTSGNDAHSGVRQQIDRGGFTPGGEAMGICFMEVACVSSSESRSSF